MAIVVPDHLIARTRDRRLFSSGYIVMVLNGWALHYCSFALLFFCGIILCCASTM